MDFDLRYDRSNYLGIVRNKARILQVGLDAAKGVSIPKDLDRIIIMGMGGSGLAGRLLKRYFPAEEIELVQDYSSALPLTSRTAVIICSHSGNTEETLTYFQSAAVSNASLVVITSGGQLGEQARSRRLPIVNLPSDLPPRTASQSMFFALLRIMANSGYEGAEEHCQPVIRAMGNERGLQQMEQYARSLAEKIGEKTPIIYGTEALREVAYTWKTNLNENSKVHAFTNVIPELCHNELAAYTEPENYYVILLNDESDSRRLKQRTDVIRSLLNRRGIENSTIMVKGANSLMKIVNTIHLGELTAIYHAVGHGVDPTPVDTIEHFKKELAEKPF